VGYQARVHHNLPDVAERAWRQTADAGNTEAMTNLGVLLYERGESTEAEQWSRKAADAGNLIGMANLGRSLYERDESTEPEQ